MTPPIDIRADHLRIVQDVLRRHLPDGVKVWVFGSRASWMTKDSSDLDLALEGDTGIAQRRLSELEAAFEDSDLPFAVDIVDVKRIGERFRQIVAQQQVRLQTKTEASLWPEVSLGNLVSNFDSRRIPLSGRVRSTRPGPYPYYGATGAMDHVDGYLFKGKHLLVAEDGSVETSSGTPFLQLVDGQFWVNNHAHVLQGATDEETRYLYYALSTVQVHPFTSGSVQTKLSQHNLNRIPVPYPPERSQRCAIAHILGTLDDKIELNRRMNATLEAMARALFRSWFVDFDPVRAKMEGRDTGLPKEVADLFPDRLVDSELGEIPEGWEWATFGDVVEQLRENENPLASPDSIFRHFSIPAFDAGQSPTAECGQNIKSQKSHVPSSVVLLSKLNPEIERVWFVDVQPDERAVCSTEFLVLRPRPPYGQPYAYCLARSPAFRQELEALVTGTSKSHQRAQVAAILSLNVVKPADALATSFERAARPLLQRTLECRRESCALAETRDTLLPKLVSGELRVNAREPPGGREGRPASVEVHGA